MTMASFDAILRSFQSDAPIRDAEFEWWKAEGLTLAGAISRACLSVIPGRTRMIRHGHQRRLPEAVLCEATAAVLSLEHEIAAATDFDELHALVCLACSSVPGTGRLYCYDVAHRIGLHVGLSPAWIYLHTGTREGAKALGINVAGREHIALSELPQTLQVLSPADAEDVLCIYKSWFGDALASRETVAVRRRC
jgi:hypothetical protein